MKKLIQCGLITLLLSFGLGEHIAAQETSSSEDPFAGVEIVSEENAIPVGKVDNGSANGVMGKTKMYATRASDPYWKVENGQKNFYNGYGELMYNRNSKKIIDVSSWQGNIDWQKVKNSGIDGAIIRIGWGYESLDSYALRNISECNRLGIPYGIYLYSYAYDANYAYYEADGLANMMAMADVNLSFPIYYDIENFKPWSETVNGKTVTRYPPNSIEAYEKVIGTFITRMNARGYTGKVHVYSYRSMLTGLLNSSKILPYVSWAAEYGSNLNFNNSYYNGISGWQYTSSGSVNGIVGNVDISCFGDYIFDPSSNGQWIKNKTGWWYRHFDGSYTTNDFEDIGEHTYYFNGDGYICNGWKLIKGQWYYLYSSGAVAKDTWIDNRYIDKDGIGTQLYKEGWIKSDNGWRYLHADGSYTTDGFEDINGYTYYFDSAGYTSSGWTQIKGSWYYLYGSGAVAKDTWIGDDYVNEDGIRVKKYKEGWIKNNIGWWYRHSDGSYTTNDFEDINGYTYYFDSRGYTSSGWKQINGNWYYLYGSGAVAKNAWIGDDYVNENGIRVQKYKEGWVKNNVGWWYRHSDGSYTTNDFEDINGYTYYFDSRGYTSSGWKQINGSWYYLYGSGAVAKNTWIGDDYVNENGIRIQKYKEGWVKNNVGWWYRHSDGSYTTNGFEDINGYTYYFDSRGYTSKGWKQINSNWYYLYSSGAVAKNTWIGNYYVNDAGVWI